MSGDILPRGKQPTEYFGNDAIEKPLDDIYRDFDSYTHELFFDDVNVASNAWLKILSPPVFHRGRFVKGLYMSPSVDYIIETYPRYDALFQSLATSMSISYPWSLRADAYLSLYPNVERDSWFRKNADPIRASKPLIPFGDADFASETRFAPIPGIKRCVDVLTISMLWKQKNLEMIAQAIKSLADEKKVRSWTLIIGRDQSELDESAQQILAELNAIMATAANCTFDLVYKVNPVLIPQFLARAKVYVLGSLFEGSNRSIKEAMLCDVPVVCFEKYNQHARGETPIFPAKAGLTAKFSVPDLAAAIAQVLSNIESFSPRSACLENGAGRVNFLETALACLPYFQNNLPSFQAGANASNSWWNTGMQDLYGVSVEQYLFAESEDSSAAGIEKIGALLANYEKILQVSGWDEG